ncbi:MAG: ParA family protein [Parcubacteria group bacterium]|nr:ParA family protein [Parcubacteria group bacterium]
MGRVISIVNQKGGVGKTTTAVNLGAALAELGKFVLLIDLDAQANATAGLGVNYQELESGVYEVVLGQKSFKDIARNTGHQGYRLAPATQNLAGLAVELVEMEEREYQLSKRILEIRNDYDYVLIDCPPSLGLVTVNGLVASDEVIIPVQSEYYALEGLGQLLQTVDLVKEHLNPALKVRGAVITMFDKRNRLSQQVLEELYQHFPHYVYRSIIPRNVRLTEAPSHGVSIFGYDSYSKGARAYDRLAREFLGQEPV